MEAHVIELLTEQAKVNDQELSAYFPLSILKIHVNGESLRNTEFIT